MRIVRTVKQKQTLRRRNISWLQSVDELAESLAFEKKFKGGVSELISRLIIAESKRKRGIAHLHAREAAK